MASGDTLARFGPLNLEPPASNPARLTEDSENRAMLDLAVDEIAIFADVFPAHYGGGGLTLEVHYAMSSATANNIALRANIERRNDGLLLTSTSYGPDNDVDDHAVPGAARTMDVATITVTDGAYMDLLAAGDAYALKLTRITPTGASAAGDLELFEVHVQET